jgi:hypothetical protein
MHKIIYHLILSFFFLFVSWSLQAQSSGGDFNGGKKNNTTSTTNSLDKAAGEAANELCQCFNKVIGELHPTLQQMMKDMVDYGEETAQNNFAAKLAEMSSEEQAAVMTSISEMENFEQKLDTQCGDITKGEKYSAYDADPAFQEKFLEKLSKLSNCDLTYKLMQIGLNKE